MVKSIYQVTINKVGTVDGERFTGLNIRGFSAIEVFMEIVLHCLGP